MRSWLRHLALWWHGSGCPEHLDHGAVCMPDGRHIYPQVRKVDLVVTLISRA